MSNPHPIPNFKPGVSGNPAGRPKKENTYSDTLRSLLGGTDIEVSWTSGGKTKTFKVTSDKNFYYGIAAAQILEALKGDTKSAREIVDRIEGRARQTIEINKPKREEIPLSDKEALAVVEYLEREKAENGRT
jgi:hypothetical protein